MNTAEGDGQLVRWQDGVEEFRSWLPCRLFRHKLEEGGRCRPLHYSAHE